MGGTGVVVSQGLWEDRVAVRRHWPGGARGREGGRPRATFTVQRGRPPSAPAFSCWKDLSEGWGLPGEGMAGWEPSPPLWLALLKICQTLQCKNRKKTGKNGDRGFGPRDRGWQGMKFQGLASCRAVFAGTNTGTA